MRKSVLSFLLVPLFMVVFGFSAFAENFYAEADSDYEFDDIYLEVVETGEYREACIKLVNDSDDSNFIDESSIIALVNEDFEPAEVLDTFADELVEIPAGEVYEYYTGEVTFDTVFGAYVFVCDVYEDVHIFVGIFGFGD